MFKSLFAVIILIFACATLSIAQNTNTSTQTTRKRATTTSTQSAAANEEQDSNTQKTSATQSRTRRAGRNQGVRGAQDPTPAGVYAAFDSLLDGIRRADVDAVTRVYWNSPQLILFNNNGTVTKGWEQMRENRASSYPNVKDVKLDIRERHVKMIGRDGAVVTCLWTQSQTYRGTPETASGRMTVVFQYINGSWKAIHLHTSPDAPDQSRALQSEPKPTSTPSPKPKAGP